ncbi:hypothetical protein M8C21_006666, partial [Ambrosia artemisiifolia]
GHKIVLPTLVIKNQQYRGKLAKQAVLKAICSGFGETTEPAICLTDAVLRIHGKNGLKKTICQVYDTVVMRVLNPNEFIMRTKHYDSPTTNEQKGRFRRLSFMIGDKVNSHGKTPPKDPKR